MLLITLSGLVILSSSTLAAAGLTYIIAFIPVNWSGDLTNFDAEATRYGEFFIEQSGIGEFANVELIFIHDRLDGPSLSDPWLVHEVIAFGLIRQPADRYIGLTDGDIILHGDADVVGWTMGPDALGMMVEAGDIQVSAHELGHTFELCDEYFFPYWEQQNEDWGCPNPFPSACPESDHIFCDGQPALDGSNSIMGPAGLNGVYTFNEPSLVHLKTVFARLFSSGESLPHPTPGVPTPQPTPVSQSIALTDPSLIRFDPDGTQYQLTHETVLHPAWSPDGQWIAFAASGDGDLDLYLTPAAGAEPHQLTDLSGRESHPAWLPDGNQIIFVSDTSGKSKLYSLNLAENQIHSLANLPAPASWPAVTSDGRSLAFAAAPGGDWDLYAVEIDWRAQPDPDTLMRLTESPGLDISPAWSRDGAALAFASSRNGSLDLFVMDFFDGNLIRLTESPSNEWAPRWLAGGQILYHAYDGLALGVWSLDPTFDVQTPLAEGLDMAAWPVPQP